MSPDPLAEAALRGRLYAQDGLEGDRIEGERALMHVMFAPKGRPGLKVPKKLGDLTEMKIGGSVVKKKVGMRGEFSLYEIPCSGCACTQLRTSAQLGATLRKGSVVVCPRCMAERRRGVSAWRSNRIKERVQKGGPIYTHREIERMRESVREALEEAFGSMVDPDDLTPLPLHPAAGWPWSHGDDLRHPFQSRVEGTKQERRRARDAARKEESARLDPRGRLNDD